VDPDPATLNSGPAVGLFSFELGRVLFYCSVCRCVINRFVCYVFKNEKQLTNRTISGIENSVNSVPVLIAICSSLLLFHDFLFSLFFLYIINTGTYKFFQCILYNKIFVIPN
jgi:hypothetical protein